MIRRFLRDHDGQNLALLAVVLVVILGIMALAIDVGNLYMERRKLQNAADAGALAGAEELCFGSGDFGVAETKAREYAVDRNLAEDADVEIDEATWTVTVTATRDVGSLLAGILGITASDVSAVAAAACGPADVSCGLWPVGFRLDEWNYLYNSGLGCGDSFYVWNGNNENQLPDCSECNCDIDGDGRRDMMQYDSRAWLDFSDAVNPLYPGCAQSGCGASELTCWVETSNPAPVRLPACVSGDTGVKAGAKDEVDGRQGDFVNIPIYDNLSCTNSGSCSDAFHIIQFGCVEVIGWWQPSEKNDDGAPVLYYLPGMGDPGDVCWDNMFLIEVKVACGNQCVTECGSTSGGPPIPNGVNAVSLIR
jgi:hypothetical protein